MSADAGTGALETRRAAVYSTKIPETHERAWGGGRWTVGHECLAMEQVANSSPSPKPNMIKRPPSDLTRSVATLAAGHPPLTFWNLPIRRVEGVGRGGGRVR